MIGDIAISSGVERERHQILGAIGQDSRIGSKYLGYGFGYGGPCIPRDMRALDIHCSNVGIARRIPTAVDQSNDLHARFLFDTFTSGYPDKSIPFLFTQLTYKVGTDILVESQQYRLCKDFLDAGYSVDITESPTVIAQVQKELAGYGDKVTYGTITEGYNISI